MAYLGFPISVEEAYRIFKLPIPESCTFYSTDDIDIFLKNKGSKLVFEYCDKGVCAFGLCMDKLTTFCMPMLNVQEATEYLYEMNDVFWSEVKKLDLDLSFVNLEMMEDEPVILKNAQPVLFG